MEPIFFNSAKGTFTRRAPTVEEFTENPSKYPGYVLLMKNETGVLHVMTNAEAQRIQDKTIITAMSAAGFFQSYLIIQVMFQ